MNVDLRSTAYFLFDYLEKLSKCIPEKFRNHKSNDSMSGIRINWNHYIWSRV